MFEEFLLCATFSSVAHMCIPSQGHLPAIEYLEPLWTKTLRKSALKSCQAFAMKSPSKVYNQGCPTSALPDKLQSITAPRSIGINGILTGHLFDIPDQIEDSHKSLHPRKHLICTPKTHKPKRQLKRHQRNISCHVDGASLLSFASTRLRQ